MKLVLPFLATVLLATSCTTAYKSGQTPDDVYFSPERKVSGNEYVQQQRGNNEYREDQPTYRSNRRNSDYRDDYAYSDEDRYLRMKVRNRNRWNDLDMYYNDPYYGSYYGRPGLYAGVGMWGGNYWSPNSYYNSWNNWNFFYNPYYNPYNRPWGHNVIVVNPSNPVYNRPRTYNLNTFNNRLGNSFSSPKGSGNNYQSFDNRPTRSAGNWGSDLRRSFGNNNSSNSNNSYSAPSRSSSNTNSSSGSSSGTSSGSSRGSAPVRKF